MVELYNDALLDLLDKSNAAKLDIKKDKKGVVVEDNLNNLFIAHRTYMLAVVSKLFTRITGTECNPLTYRDDIRHKRHG